MFVCSGFVLSALSLLQELITESQMQSVFTDIGKINFRDPSSYYVIPSVPGLASNSVASAAWLSSEGEALFALPSASGGIFILKLPPHDAPGKEREQAASSHPPLPNTARCGVPSPSFEFLLSLIFGMCRTDSLHTHKSSFTSCL